MKASEIIKNMFVQRAGSIVVTTLQGKTHVVKLNRDGKTISSETGLRTQQIDLSIFDIVVDFLRSNGGMASKGNGRNSKVGYGKCTSDTVCYCIATKYYGHNVGESTFDPVFIIAAILDMAGICENSRGYLRLNIMFLQCIN